jgi:hypothetical protein
MLTILVLNINGGLDPTLLSSAGPRPEHGDQSRNRRGDVVEGKTSMAIALSPTRGPGITGHIDSRQFGGSEPGEFDMDQGG